ncbi:MAG: hypothetical protein K9N46_11250 [Candidatus Marinimicrobia bacterium]|nr:hypothetical protein [Candidatus Neomarinimicrobiota bacterium]MCF7827641.1 hypothetical protein [Candidatus Neomarinimicrobiota bacterium]MCF7881304.1 hypothetical protein [Candidatus Neomarinimicrobiota bacterium]
MVKTKESTRKDWRQFGLGLAVILAILGTLQWILHNPLYLWAYSLSGVIAVSALVFPVLLKPVFIMFSYIGLAIGWVMTRVLLSLVLYVIITPIGILSRLLGKPFLDMRFKTDEDSYWIDREETGPSKEHYEKQY